jgi:SAM-dependent methyltransferase
MKYAKFFRLRRRPDRLLRIFLSRLPTPRHYCPLCNKHLLAFLPYPRQAPLLISALDGIGSDLSRFSCPWCGSHDRERHLFLYMQAQKLFAYLKEKIVLHFAPEKQLSKKILEAKPWQYICCDLYPVHPKVMKVDLLAMPFANESIDLLIANHVLEHVADDLAALAEIVRVLKPGGLAILQTPYSAKLAHTWADPGIDDDKARLEAYGQEDHVRLYGRDIFQRISGAGLLSQVADHQSLLPYCDANYYGVNPREPFFLFQK